MRPRFLVPVAAILTIALFFAVRAPSQQRFGLYAPAWEYASAVASPFYNYISVCYVTSNIQGCRYEAINGSLMRATAILGAEGWELTGTTTDTGDTYTLYFKRIKTGQ